MKAGRSFPLIALAVTIVSIVGVSIALAAGELVPDRLPPVSPIILPKTPEIAAPAVDPTTAPVSSASPNTELSVLVPPSTTNAPVAPPPSVPISPTAPNSEPIPQQAQSTAEYAVPPSALVPTSKPAQAEVGSDNDGGEDDGSEDDHGSEDDDEPDESED